MDYHWLFLPLICFCVYVCGGGAGVDSQGLGLGGKCQPYCQAMKTHFLVQWQTAAMRKLEKEQEVEIECRGKRVLIGISIQG